MVSRIKEEVLDDLCLSPVSTVCLSPLGVDALEMDNDDLRVIPLYSLTCKQEVVPPGGRPPSAVGRGQLDKNNSGKAPRTQRSAINQGASRTRAKPGTGSSREDFHGRYRYARIRDRLAGALETNAYQDVTFLVGKGHQKMSAHKLILRLSSPVFSEICKKLEMETGSTSTNNITFEDIEPFVFSCVLQFIYTDKFDTNAFKSEDMISVLKVAKKFEIQLLVQECVQYLKTNITDDNVIRLSQLAFDINDDELQQLSLLYICRNARMIFDSAHFLEIRPDLLSKLLEMDELAVDELYVFKSVLRYADEICQRLGLEPTPQNRRESIGDIVNKIRFPLLSPQEFTLWVMPTALLTTEDQLEFYKFTSLPESSKERHELQPTSFNANRRFYVPNLDLNGADELREEAVGGRTKALISLGESPNCLSALTTRSASNDFTEPENEDASSLISSGTGISSVSPSHTTQLYPNKRARSPSPIQSVSKSHKRDKKSSNTRFDFTSRKFILKDSSIDFNSFVEEIGKSNLRKEIESIRLQNVILKEIPSAKSKALKMPKLREFCLDLKIESLNHEQVNALSAQIDLSSFMFFNTTPAKLWSTNVNISLAINGITLLNINHEKGSIKLNKLKSAGCLVEGACKSSTLKSLALSHPKFPEILDTATIPNIEQLVLISIKSSIPEVGKFLRKFTKLTELILNSTEMKRIDICNDLVSEKMHKLSLGFARLQLGLPSPLKLLRELFLFRCEWSATFENNFHLLFPNLVKFSVGVMTSVKPNLAARVIKIRSIQQISFNLLQWGSIDESDADQIAFRDLVASTELNGSEKTFTLVKKVSDGAVSWSGRPNTDAQDVYNNFRFSYFYKSYDLFKS